jgi:predicted acylesterase/phospholipase RssA
MFSRFRLFAALIGAATLNACATGPDLTPIDAPLPATPAVAPATPTDRGLDGEVVALAFSGGGARAAAASYGVLLELRDRRRPDGVRWIDRVAFVTSVSGGSLTAAWFGLHGPDGLDGLRPALLDKDWHGEIHSSLAWPPNWVRMAHGGVNGRDRIADWLDREVYRGARMGDLRGPPVLLNAVELYTGTPFVFAEPWLQALCGDLETVRLADAVAASAAYPLAVRPVVLGAYGETCGQPLPDWVAQAAADREGPIVVRETARAFQMFRDPERLRYAHLLDGGVIDNFGLSGIAVMQRASGLPYGPLLGPRDAVRISCLRVIVVNAERGGDRSWGQTPEGPDGRQVLEAVTDHFVDGTKRNAYDAFLGHLERWERQTIAWRCSLSPEAARALDAPDGWDCADLDYTLEVVAFADLPAERARAALDLPTRLSLTPEQVDLAIQGGRDIIARQLR